MIATPTAPNAERVATLRRRCLERKRLVNWMDRVRETAASLKASEDEPSWILRRGRLSRDRLAGTEFALDDLELLVGRPAPRPAMTAEEQEAAEQYLRRYSFPGGQTGHCELDRSRAFAVGLDGLRAEIRPRLAVVGGGVEKGCPVGRAVPGAGDPAEDRGLQLAGPAACPEAAETYRSFLLALDGLGMVIEKGALTARAAMAGAIPERRAELKAMAASCERIAHGPPQSFRDALQLLWFIDYAVTVADTAGLVGPGHLDRTLWPFYAADVTKGALTRDEALVLLEQLYLLLNEFIPDGLAIPVMVGGRDAQGRDVTNELSYLCLEALRRTKLVYPTVGVCWHEGTPDSLSALAVDLIGQGYSNPAFFGDETIQGGLQAYGVPAAEACNYVNSTCVEITPVGASNVWVASPYYPLCKLLLDEIAAQVQTDRPAPTFEALVASYRARLSAAVTEGAREQNALRAARSQWGGKPLQSVFTRDCVARGQDIDRGGALYNWVECSFVGMANLVDSLYVIREEVYRQRRLTLPQLHALLAADFQGHEEERSRFLHRYPKYGNDCAEVDGMVAEWTRCLREECGRHTMAPDGAPYVPGMFCWIMHEMLGRECGATPDGRRAGFPFADGAGPAQGREQAGPTAGILSTTSWDHGLLIGGLAYNMKFSRALFASRDAFRRLQDLIVTYLRRGGFETQINVVDADVLRHARRNPEAYADLVVRIGGYTDYFTRLSPQMQDEVMLRTEFTRL